MDMSDPQIRSELANRLAAIGEVESGDPAHAHLSIRDLSVFAAVCTALVALGLIVAAL